MNAFAPERRFVCSDCKHVHSMWAARCASCHSLRGLVLAVGADVDRELSAPAEPLSVEESQEAVKLSRPRLMIARPPKVEPPDPGPVSDDLGTGTVGSIAVPISVPISEIAEESFVRNSTGLPPLDHVLGGGLVVASVVLLASPPGIGKTTLTLQMLKGLQHCCLYATGEETKEQVAATGRRVGVVPNHLYLLHEYDLERIFLEARVRGARTIAIDSIQKMQCEDVNGRAGATVQLKECTARVVKYAKATGTSIWLIGHVTSDGDIAGPKTIEHDVDVVLELGPGSKFDGNERILRCPGKNRFGATNVTGYFELTAKGFVAVDADGWNEKL